jgi:uncharacterized protein (TIGR03000 family)
MRKMLLVLSVAGLTVLVSASDAFAQFGVFGLRSRPLVSIDLGDGGYYSPFGYYGGPGYGPYYRGYGYGYAPRYNDGPLEYSNYSRLAPLAPTTQVRQSNYPAPATAHEAVGLKVLVPTADAKVWFENQETSQQGMERLFESPPLKPNQHFTYNIKARWTENGKTVNHERRVHVLAGQNITVNFRENPRESIAAPLPQGPNAIPKK